MKNVNKNFKFYIIAWAILLLLFNVLVFTIPGMTVGAGAFGGSFWVGYVFITLAFAGQLACAYYAFRADSMQKLFYNLPLVTISYAALIVTAIAGVLCMVIPGLPAWVGIAVCVLILALFAVSIVKAKAAGNIVTETDQKIKSQTLFIKSLTADAEGLIARAQSDAVRAQTKKVYEAVRYSDPMSSEALAGAEAQITIKFDEFSKAVTADDLSAVQAAAKELTVLLGDRNRKCKLLK